MTVLANADKAALPIHALALSTLVDREADAKLAGTGLGFSCLTPSGVYIATLAAGTESTTPEIDDSLRQLCFGWVRTLENIGLAPIVMTLKFDDQPAVPQSVVLTPLDAAALVDSIATVMLSAGIDPLQATCIIGVGRRNPGATIGAISALTGPSCDARAKARLIAAVDSWLAPRRQWFQSLQEFHFELNVRDYWAVACMMRKAAGEGDTELRWMPVAGSA